jgi:hypothetical protein
LQLADASLEGGRNDVTVRSADLAAFHERRLPPAEARAYLDAVITEAERNDVSALVSWFRQRYPTPAERLAYVRRAYARRHRTLGAGLRP